MPGSPGEGGHPKEVGPEMEGGTEPDNFPEPLDMNGSHLCLCTRSPVIDDSVLSTPEEPMGASR